MQRVGFHRVCLTTLARRVKTMAARGEHWRGDRMVRARLGWGGLGLAVGRCLLAGRGGSQQPVDSAKVYHLPPVTVSVTRADLPFTKTPLAVQLLDKPQISRARPPWGLDESLAAVPGIYAANRYNFSLDPRISLRALGTRSAS